MSPAFSSGHQQLESGTATTRIEPSRSGPSLNGVDLSCHSSGLAAPRPQHKSSSQLGPTDGSLGSNSTKLINNHNVQPPPQASIKTRFRVCRCKVSRAKRVKRPIIGRCCCWRAADCSHQSAQSATSLSESSSSSSSPSPATSSLACHIDSQVCSRSANSNNNNHPRAHSSRTLATSLFECRSVGAISGKRTASPLIRQVSFSSSTSSSSAATFSSASSSCSDSELTSSNTFDKCTASETTNSCANFHCCSRKDESSPSLSDQSVGWSPVSQCSICLAQRKFSVVDSTTDSSKSSRTSLMATNNVDALQKRCTGRRPAGEGRQRNCPKSRQRRQRQRQQRPAQSGTGDDEECRRYGAPTGRPLQNRLRPKQRWQSQAMAMELRHVGCEGANSSQYLCNSQSYASMTKGSRLSHWDKFRRTQCQRPSRSRNEPPAAGLAHSCPGAGSESIDGHQTQGESDADRKHQQPEASYEISCEQKRRSSSLDVEWNRCRGGQLLAGGPRTEAIDCCSTGGRRRRWPLVTTRASSCQCQELSLCATVSDALAPEAAAANGAVHQFCASVRANDDDDEYDKSVASFACSTSATNSTTTTEVPTATATATATTTNDAGQWCRMQQAIAGSNEAERMMTNEHKKGPRGQPCERVPLASARARPGASCEVLAGPKVEGRRRQGAARTSRATAVDVANQAERDVNHSNATWQRAATLPQPPPPSRPVLEDSFIMRPARCVAHHKSFWSVHQLAKDLDSQNERTANSIDHDNDIGNGHRGTVRLAHRSDESLANGVVTTAAALSLRCDVLSAENSTNKKVVKEGPELGQNQDQRRPPELGPVENVVERTAREQNQQLPAMTQTGRAGSNRRRHQPRSSLSSSPPAIHRSQLQSYYWHEFQCWGAIAGAHLARRQRVGGGPTIISALNTQANTWTGKMSQIDAGRATGLGDMVLDSGDQSDLRHGELDENTDQDEDDDDDDSEAEERDAELVQLAESLGEFAQRLGCVHCHCRHQLLMLVRNEQILKLLTERIKQGVAESGAHARRPAGGDKPSRDPALLDRRQITKAGSSRSSYDEVTASESQLSGLMAAADESDSNRVAAAVLVAAAAARRCRGLAGTSMGGVKASRRPVRGQRRRTVVARQPDGRAATSAGLSDDESDRSNGGKSLPSSSSSSSSAASSLANEMDGGETAAAEVESGSGESGRSSEVDGDETADELDREDEEQEVEEELDVDGDGGGEDDGDEGELDELEADESYNENSTVEVQPNDDNDTNSCSLVAYENKRAPGSNDSGSGGGGKGRAREGSNLRNESPSRWPVMASRTTSVGSPTGLGSTRASQRPDQRLENDLQRRRQPAANVDNRYRNASSSSLSDESFDRPGELHGQLPSGDFVRRQMRLADQSDQSRQRLIAGGSARDISPSPPPPPPPPSSDCNSNSFLKQRQRRLAVSGGSADQQEPFAPPPLPGASSVQTKTRAFGLLLGTRRLMGAGSQQALAMDSADDNAARSLAFSSSASRKQALQFHRLHMNNPNLIRRRQFATPNTSLGSQMSDAQATPGQRMAPTGTIWPAQETPRGFRRQATTFDMSPDRRLKIYEDQRRDGRAKRLDSSSFDCTADNRFQSIETERVNFEFCTTKQQQPQAMAAEECRGSNWKLEVKSAARWLDGQQTAATCKRLEFNAQDASERISMPMVRSHSDLELYFSLLDKQDQSPSFR